MAKSFLLSQGYSVKDFANKVVGRFDKTEISVSFDDLGRIINVSSRMGDFEEENPKKKSWMFWKR